MRNLIEIRKYQYRKYKAYAVLLSLIRNSTKFLAQTHVRLAKRYTKEKRSLNLLSV